MVVLTKHRLTQVRKIFWIPKGRQIARTALSKCIHCKKVGELFYLYSGLPTLIKKWVNFICISSGCRYWLEWVKFKLNHLTNIIFIYSLVQQLELSHWSWPIIDLQKHSCYYLENFTATSKFLKALFKEAFIQSFVEHHGRMDLMNV